ncbi:MAG: glutathione S-transferase family protein [Nevskiales bacterium]
MVTLYGMTGSGNCYKPALLLNLLGKPYHWIEVDLLKGQTRTPEFLAKNPNGKVPVLEVDGRYLAESNAMLCYLAEGTAFLPQEAWQRAQVLQWLFFEQYSHEPYIATVRFWIHYLKKETEWAQKIAETRPKGYAALDVMERQLSKSDWLAYGRCTVADLALYAYTHVAHQGGYELDRYPGVQAWLKRVTQLPGFVNTEQASRAGA